MRETRKRRMRRRSLPRRLPNVQLLLRIQRTRKKKISLMRNQNIHQERDLEELPRRAQQLWQNLRRKLPPRNPRRRLRNPLEKRQRQRNRRRSSEETKNC